MTWRSILKREIKKGFANMADTNLSDNDIEVRNSYLLQIFEIARHLAIFEDGKRRIWYNDNIRGEYEDLTITTRQIRHTLRDNPKANKENSNLEKYVRDLDRKLSKFATAVTNFYNSQRGKKILRSFMGRDKNSQERFLKNYNGALNYLKKSLMEGDFAFEHSQPNQIGFYADVLDSPTVVLDPKTIGSGKKGIQNLTEIMSHEAGHRASRKLKYPYSKDGKRNLFFEEALAHTIEYPDEKDRLKRLVSILGRDDILEFVENSPDISNVDMFNSMYDAYQELLEERNKGKREEKLRTLEGKVENLVEEVNAKNDAEFGKSMGWQDTLKASCMAHKMGTPCSCEKCGSTTKAKKYSKKQIEAFDKDGNGVPFEPKDMKLLGKE